MRLKPPSTQPEPHKERANERPVDQLALRCQAPANWTARSEFPCERLLAQPQAADLVRAVLKGMKAAFADGQLIMDRVAFTKQLKTAFKAADVKMDSALLKALLLPNALGERDPAATPCIASLGGFEPDPELRDTEQVPLPPNISLPLPISYDDKDSKKALIDLVREHCKAYLTAEVLPYRPDAWIDFDKTKVGYEIPFTRHFYEYQPPRPLAVIEQEVKDLEAEIARMLEGVV